MWEQVARAAADDAGCPDALRQASRASRWSTASRGSTTTPAPDWPSGWGPTRPTLLLGTRADRSRSSWWPKPPPPWPGADSTWPWWSGARPWPPAVTCAEPEWSFRPDGEPALPADPDRQEVANGIYQAYLTFALLDTARRAPPGRRPRRPPGPPRAPAGPHDRGGGVPAGARLVPDGQERRRDHDPVADQPDGGDPLHQADDRHHGRGHGRRRAGGHRRSRPTPWAFRPTSGSTCEGAGAAETLAPWRPGPSCGARRPWSRPCARPSDRLSVDEVAHLDLYSCFASSLSFARDALGHRRTTRDPRP